jgi:hypothetical protein
LSAKQRFSAAVVGVTLSLAASGPAAADFKVWTPDVDYGELSFENIGDLGLDRNRSKNGAELHHRRRIRFHQLPAVTVRWQAE